MPVCFDMNNTERERERERERECNKIFIVLSSKSQ